MNDEKYLDSNGVQYNIDRAKTEINKRLLKTDIIPASPKDNEIILYTGNTTSAFTKGGIYEYHTGTETDLYAWTESTSTIFTETETPTVGDSTYDSEGAEIGTIEAVGTGKITVDGAEYERNAESDTTITIGRGWNLISTSDLSAGDGISIEDGKVSSTVPIFTGTEEEWEQMTDDEKAHYLLVCFKGDGKTYFVTDTVTPTGENPVSAKGVYLFALEKVTEMPETPTDEQVVLYVGETTTDYTKGTIYQYSESETKWNPISTAEIEVDAELSETSENPLQNKVTTQEIKKRLLVSDTMPTPSDAYTGSYRLYIGTSANYTRGGIYECVETSTDTFEWVERNKADVDLTLYKKIFNGTQATWDSLDLETKIQYDLANITDDYNESEEIEDITSQLTFHTDNIAGGNAYVSKYGKIVQVDVRSIKVTAYSKDIISGLPKPINGRGNTFPAQGDGNPQTLGLFMISADGVLSSGTQSAGLAPNVVWDATFHYLTED